MIRSPARFLGALDVLVKAGEVSPAYAAGIADILCKEADYTPWPDSDAENIREEWEDFVKDNPSYNPETGDAKVTGEQAKRILRNSRHFWTDRPGIIADYAGTVGDYLWHKIVPGTNDMTWREAMSMHEIKRNRRDLAHIRRLLEQGAVIPPQLAGALQDQHAGDMQKTYHTFRRFLPPSKMEAQVGETVEDAMNRFRTNLGRKAMVGGYVDPKYDRQVVKPRVPVLHNNPAASMYGSEQRDRLFSRDFRNSLGVY